MPHVFDILRACRRSRIKTRVYAALVAQREALVPELADAARTTPARVMAALHGDREEFRADTSLTALGVARRALHGPSPTYAITPAGERAWAFVRARLPRGVLAPHDA